MTSPSEPVSFEGVNLPAVGLVAELSDEDRAMLSSYGRFGYVEADTEIIHLGTSQNDLYFVLSGKLHVTRNDEGRTVLLGSIGKGEWFGEINIFDPGAASATVSAVEPTQLWSINREDLLVYLGTYPEAAVRLLVGVATILSRRMRDVSQKLVRHVEYEKVLSRIEG